MRPDFIIIGAGRAGTTSLYHYLRQIPQIFMSPVKETNFFAFQDGVSDAETEIRPPAGDLCSVRHNASGIPRSRALQRLLDRSRPAKRSKARFAASRKNPLVSLAVKLRNANLRKPTLSPTLRDELTDLYRDDVTALKSIVGRDLMHWLRQTPA